MKERDLTSGSIYKNLVSMSLPTILGFLSYTLYDLVDMAWIGRISPEAVAAVTIVTTIFWLIEIFNEVIGTSSVSLISQSYGSGNMERARRVIEQTLTFKSLVALIAAVLLLLLLKPLSFFFTEDQEVRNYCLEYGYIRLFFLPVFFASYTVNTALRCTGDAKKPMVIMFLSSIINIVLDPLLMFDIVPGTRIPGLGLGVFGAALATVISITIAFVLGFAFLFTRYVPVRISFRGLFRLDWEIDKKLLSIGFPTGLEMFFRNLAQFLTLKFVSLYGTVAVAAIGIGIRLMNFAFMPLLGLLMGGSTIVGQNLGANKVDRASQTARTASIMGGTIQTFILLLIIFIPRQIMGIFVTDTAVIEAGIPMIRIVAGGLVAAGFMMGLASVFSGSGYNLPFLVSSLISRWGVQVAFLLITILIFKAPLIFVWISFLISDIVEFLVVLLFYRRGRWKKTRV